MRYWYVEDAGGGCRAFSEVLVLVCENPRLVYKAFLPLTWDHNVTMEEMARRKVVEMMRKAGVTREDYLYVCSGNIFYDLHRWLTENGYRWETVKMEGLAHEVAESAFHHQIIAAGFPAEIKLENRNYRDFYRLVDRWLQEDPQRSRFFKDMEVRRKPEKFRYLLKGNAAHTRLCARCRKKILPYTPIVQYRYRENGKKKNCYFHPACSPVKPHKNKLEQVQVLWRGNPLEGVILPVRQARPCMVCGEEIPPGPKALHALNGRELVFGHPDCFANPGGNSQRED